MNTNTYTAEFTCRDPEHGLPVKYSLTVKVKAPDTVHPAEMMAWISRFTSKAVKQEDLADKFKTRFPGQHILIGNHFGVHVRTDRAGTGT